MENKIQFGTDGWRGLIAEDFTFDNVRACAQGVAAYLQETGLASGGLVIGYDTRFASEDFAAAAAEVIAGNGIKAHLCSSAAPTPVVSYAIRSRRASGAIIITASHNPARWNGFKYKPEYAGSASQEVVDALESHIDVVVRSGRIERTPAGIAEREGLLERFDPAPDYLHHLGGLVDLSSLKNAGLKVAVDSMHGAGAGYLKALLRGGKTLPSEIRALRNPIFPGMGQPEPIAANLRPLKQKIASMGAQVGLATDGDADRLGVMDEDGNFLTTLQVFALLALYMLEVRGERGAIVKSLTTTRMLHKLGELYRVPVFEAPVGFKYIGPIMMRENALIAGEESGGYAFRGHIPERDGILSGLYILDMLVQLRMKPSEVLRYLYSKVGESHFKRIDIPFAAGLREETVRRISQAAPSRLDGIQVMRVDTTDGFRFLLADTSWVLIRFSGTEPLLRIYGEGDTEERVDKLLKAARNLAGV